ncbi:MAG: hypothetical protein AAF378_20090, partial [Cyanobacteria bacterium P01_A01_bin.84]
MPKRPKYTIKPNKTFSTNNKYTRSLCKYQTQIIQLKKELSQISQGSPLKAYENAPVSFAYKLGIEIVTEDQKQILLSVRDRKVTNVQASHSCGKTMISAIAATWWIFCCDGLVITTAPTGRQVKELLWREIRKLYDRNKTILGGYRNILSVHKNSNA